jgi:hypothetical protein
MNKRIQEALSNLDVENEGHWTTEGLPRLDVMKDLVGEPVSRADITTAAKGFSRRNPSLDNEEPEKTGNGESDDAETTQVEETENTAKVPAIQTEANAEDEEAELIAARANMDAAQRRLLKATEAMDVVIMSRSVEQNSRTHAEAVKEFQRSQQEQRARAAQNRKLMADAVLAAQNKF